MNLNDKTSSGYSRREFLINAAVAGAVARISLRKAAANTPTPGLAGFTAPPPPTITFADQAGLNPSLGVFANPEPLVTALPVAGQKGTVAGVPYYELAARESTDYQFHSRMPATTVWGYADLSLPANSPSITKLLGPLIVATKGKPIKLQIRNQLPGKHLLPLDTSLMGTHYMDQRGSMVTAPACRIATHLHGGHVAPQNDGHPDAWVGPETGSQATQLKGPQFVGSYLNTTAQPGDPLQGVIYDYPNDQSARLMWYHDHSLGITRLNAYAGLASGYLITDPFEAAITKSAGNPNGIPGLGEYGGTHIPLIIQDRAFYGAGAPQDINGKPLVGQLWYPDSYDPADLPAGYDPTLVPSPSCVPEFFGNTMVVNGKIWPILNVERVTYRFRVLNGCQARFLGLKLFASDAVGNINAAPAAFAGPGPGFVQIGTEAGFLAGAVLLNDPVDPCAPKLVLSPGERADILVDFSMYGDSKQDRYFVLWNDLPAPYPSGGLDPSSQPIMLFRVPAGRAAAAPLKVPILPPVARSGLLLVTKSRDLLLWEGYDSYGRLMQQMGTVTFPAGGKPPSLTNLGYLDPITESPKVGTYELWRFWNTTADVHPIHIHLANHQIISRQEFLASDFTTPVGPAVPPLPNEADWKETTRVYPGRFDPVSGQALTVTCTTIVLRFDAPQAWAGTAGEYMWHCHILEHEEHDMMRRFRLVK